MEDIQKFPRFSLPCLMSAVNADNGRLRGSVTRDLLADITSLRPLLPLARVPTATLRVREHHLRALRASCECRFDELIHPLKILRSSANQRGKPDAIRIFCDIYATSHAPLPNHTPDDYDSALAIKQATEHSFYCIFEYGIVKITTVALAYTS